MIVLVAPRAHARCGTCRAASLLAAAAASPVAASGSHADAPWRRAPVIGSGLMLPPLRNRVLEEGHLRARALAASGCLVAALAFGVAACGSDDNGSCGGGSGQHRLQLPDHLLQPPAAGRLAAAVAVGRQRREAGPRRRPAARSASTRSSTSASTTPPRPPASGSRAQTSANARKAAQDKTTIAYLGEFNSGATAISLPILNEAGILQISPSNTDVGLTRKPRAPTRASPTSTTRRASAPTAASSPPTTSRPRRR